MQKKHKHIKLFLALWYQVSTSVPALSIYTIEKGLVTFIFSSQFAFISVVPLRIHGLDNNITSN